MSRSQLKKSHIVSDKQLSEADELLKKLPIEVREKALKKALREAGKVVVAAAKPNVPVGDPDERKEGATALNKTLAVKLTAYRDDSLHVAIIGTRWPEGAHGHLVEWGHQIKVRGPGKATGRKPGKEYAIDQNDGLPQSGYSYVGQVKFLAPAADSTRVQQERAIVNTIVDEIKEVGG